MPTDRQISQLVLQVDANIAVAQRDLQNLARVVNQTSGQMNNSLASTAQAHSRLSGAFNQSRIAQMELSHVMTASVDAYAAGASPLRILTLEMGRVAQAASFMGGGGGVMGKLGAFMGGPWGIAVLLATNVLAQLIGKFAAGSDSVADLVQKMREHAKQAADSKRADEEWSRTIDGLIERNEKLTDDLKKRLKAEEDLDQQTLRQAQGDKAKAEKELQDAKTQLANLKAEFAAAQRQAASGGGLGTNVGGVAEARLQQLREQVAAAEQRVRTAQQAIASASSAITQNTIAVGEAQAKALTDASAAVDLWAKNYISVLHHIENVTPQATTQLAAAFDAVKKSLEDAAGAKVPFRDTGLQADKLLTELRQGKITVGEYATAMQKLAKALEAVADAAKNAKKGAGEFGKQISFSDAAAIAKGAGLTVTSGYRSTAKQAQLYNTVRTPENPVARPGTSAHEGVNGKWALDIAFAPGLTPEKIRKIYGDQGVSLSAIYKESGHFHIEGSRSQAAAAESAQARAEKKAKVDDDSFARESAQLDAQTLSARQQLIAGYDSQADLASQQVEAERVATQAAIQKQRDNEQLSADQAKELSLQADNLAAARQAAIAHKKYTDGLNQLAEMAKQQSDFQIEDLRFADEMAKTQSEHRKIQLQILDIQYQQKEADLKRLLLSIQSNKDFATSVDLQQQAMEVQAQLARLPIERSQGQQRVIQGTLDPLQRYFDNIPHTADQINESLKSIEAQGLDGLVNALTHVGEGWGAMRDAAISALQDIASQLIRLGIQRMLFSLLGNTILGGGGFSGLGGLGGGISGGFAGSSVSLAGATDFSGSFGALSGIGGFRAEGGPVTAGVPYIVGERRAEVFVPQTNGFILPSVSRIPIPKPANSNAPGDTYHVHVTPQSTGDPVKDRQTAMQWGAGIRAGLAKTTKKGLVA